VSYCSQYCHEKWFVLLHGLVKWSSSPTWGVHGFIIPLWLLRSSLFFISGSNFYHQGVVFHLFPECGVCEVEEWGMRVMFSGPSHSVIRILLST